MPKPLGALLFAAAAVSILFPARPKARALTPPAPAPTSRPRARNQLFALIQTKPHVVVLAVSDSRTDLEMELLELNETWNHWDLRRERHRFDIQPVTQLDTRLDETLRLVA